MWQIKLGMWVDETGKARTVAGGFADGLSRTELELGYYATESGKVCDRTGQFVRKTKEATEAEKEYNISLQQTRERFADAFQALGDGAGRLSTFIALFDGVNEGANDASRSFAELASVANVASQSFSFFQNLGAGIQEAKAAVVALNKAMAASATTAQGLKAVAAARGVEDARSATPFSDFVSVIPFLIA